MSSLPFEPSDSEDEFVIGTAPDQLISPPDSPQMKDGEEDEEKKNEKQKEQKVHYFAPPTITRLNPSTTIPANVTLILGTDLVTSSYLEYSTSLANAIDVVKITMKIQKDKSKKNDPKEQKNKTKSPSPQQLDQPKYINYTLSLLPNSGIVVGTCDLDISAKYANFFAQSLVSLSKNTTNTSSSPPKAPVSPTPEPFSDFSSQFLSGQQYWGHIEAIYMLVATPICALSAHNQLDYSSSQNYPIIYTIDNLFRLKSSIRLSSSTLNALNAGLYQFKDNKTGNKVEFLPHSVPLTGFAAALLTYSTLYHVPCVAGISISHAQYQTELLSSFEKLVKVFGVDKNQFGLENKEKSEKSEKGAEKDGNFASLSMYPPLSDRITVGMRTVAVKAILKLLEGKLAYQSKMLPHAKQSGQVPMGMFF